MKCINARAIQTYSYLVCIVNVRPVKWYMMVCCQWLDAACAPRSNWLLQGCSQPFMITSVTRDSSTLNWQVEIRIYYTNNVLCEYLRDFNGKSLEKIILLHNPLHTGGVCHYHTVLYKEQCTRNPWLSDRKFVLLCLHCSHSKGQSYSTGFNICSTPQPWCPSL